jgi:hypothetical protein
VHLVPNCTPKYFSWSSGTGKGTYMYILKQ